VISTPLPIPPAVLHLAPSGVGSWLMVALLFVLAVLVGVHAYRNTLPELSARRRWILRILRWTSLLLVLFMFLEPVVVRRSRRSVPPGVLLLVDASRSMGLAGAPGITRGELAERWKEMTARRLRRRPEGVEVIEGRGARRLWRPGREGAGDGTNLPALLLSGARSHVQDNLQAIVLFSDGVDTDRERPSLSGLKVPVFTVAVGDSNVRGDLRLDHVRYPALVFRGEKVEIDAEAVVDAPRAGRSWAVLEGGIRPDSLEISWPAGGGRFPLAFTVTADSLGMIRRTLRLLPLPEEALLENNLVELAMQVRRERLRVVMVEERPSWDFHFLRRRFARDRRFELEGVYRRREQWVIAGSDSLWVPPRDADAAAGVDVWIVASLDDLQEMATAAPGIEASVRQGAGLLTLFGERRSRTLAALSPRARALLPVTIEAGARWVEGEQRAELTAAGVAHPILDLPGSVGPAASRLDGMPPLWEAVRGLRPRPAADVLLRLRGQEGTTPLLVVGRHGKGKVAAWTAAPLWSWSYWRLGAEDNEDVYFALTGNLLFYLAEGGERARLRLILPRPVVAMGEDVALRAVVLDSRLQPDSDSDLWLEWRRDDGAAVDSTTEAEGRVLMEVDRSTPGGRTRQLPALPPGGYHLRVALEERGGRIVSPWRSLTIDPYSVEFQRPGVDAAALAALARSTGGRRLTADELQEWADRVPLSPETRTRIRRIPLWASLGLFLSLIVSLSLEWALRRRWGMI